MLALLVILGVSLLAGIAFIPATIAFLGPGIPMFLRKLYGPLLWIVASNINGKTVLMPSDGRFDVFPARGDDEVFVDGEWRTIEGGIENWDRLGWAPFAVANTKDDETAFSDFRAETNSAAMNVVADGGIGLLDDLKRGYRGFTMFPNGADDGVLISQTKLGEQIKRSSGVQTINEQREKALEKFGGDDGMSTMMVTISIVVCLVLGYGTVWMSLSI